MTKIYRIAVLVDTSSGWGRRIIRGIANYGLKHGQWHLSVDETGMNESMHLKSGWEGDGIIARVKDRKLYQELMRSGKPIVNVSGIQMEGINLPCVTTNRGAAAELALRHFTERGFRNLAYYGPQQLVYVKSEADAFYTLTHKKGLHCEVYQSQLNQRSYSRESERLELLNWIESLPKPVGIYTWGTRVGRDILNVCASVGIAVPESVAVLAGDDDQLLCEVCSPTLSGIVTPAMQIGHEAARILDQILQGNNASNNIIQISPIEVNCRGSTDTLAVEDEAVNKALQFIRENANKAIDVNQVVKATGISRRSLERRFESIVGCSPAKEIQRAHMRRAQKLLKETDMSVVDIATASGYGSAEYMISIFKKTTGLTPQKYSSWVRSP